MHEANEYYLIARKYDQHSEDDGKEHLYKKYVRYCCKKALKADINHAQTWALLADVYSWLSMVYSHPSGFSQKIKIRRIERSIFCIKQAMKNDLNNYEYAVLLKRYYHIRNEEYKPEWETRII